ncbi:hypothetical protein D3C76_1472810 [compost metagenome]
MPIVKVPADLLHALPGQVMPCITQPPGIELAEHLDIARAGPQAHLPLDGRTHDGFRQPLWRGGHSKHSR